MVFSDTEFITGKAKYLISGGTLHTATDTTILSVLIFLFPPTRECVSAASETLPRTIYSLRTSSLMQHKHRGLLQSFQTLKQERGEEVLLLK